MKFLVSAFFALLAFVSAAQAGQGGSVTGPLDPTTYEPVSVSYGDSAVFEISGVTQEQHPWVVVKCFQGRTQVYQGAALYYETMDWKQFVFKFEDSPGSPYRWPNGGAAHCTVELSVLLNKNHKVVDKLEFDVSA